MNQEQFTEQLEQCKRLTYEKQYAEALVLAHKLLEQDPENLALHRLLAMLYGLSEKYMEAAAHYMMLVQFDPTFEYRHCIELVNGYHAKGFTDMAAVLAHTGAIKLNSKPLYEIAADYYQKTDNAEQAKAIRDLLKESPRQ